MSRTRSLPLRASGFAVKLESSAREREATCADIKVSMHVYTDCNYR